MVFPTYRSYQKHPLPVNMAVVVEKSVNLLKESSGNCPKYKKYVDIETHKEG